MMPAAATVTRRTAPVFVLGCPRSGTTLLYHMLLSAGGFAVYLAESNIFNFLGPRFGDLGQPANRERMLSAWLGSKLFRATGLDAGLIAERLRRDGRSHGAFLRIVMEAVAGQQGAQRWAENSPESLLYLPRIQREIPGALVLHVIRDGRDVAMSLSQLQYLRTVPWRARPSLLASAAYWQWMVTKGRQHGQNFGDRYLEVRFEQLVNAPRSVLAQVSEFLDQPLDHGQIQRVAYGSVRKPNTSFAAESANNASGDSFHPVDRWRRLEGTRELEQVEGMIRGTLEELGYAPSEAAGQGLNVHGAALRRGYEALFEAKRMLKNSAAWRSLMPRLTSGMIDAAVLGEDGPPPIGAIGTIGAID